MFVFVATDLAMWTGRVARLISEESKELSRALAFSLATGREDDQREEDLFALKSGSGKGNVGTETKRTTLLIISLFFF
jgi:hypothetical protein